MIAKIPAVQTSVLDPGVKAWLDNVIVPALVSEYLTLCRNTVLSDAPEDELACGTEGQRQEENK